MLNLPFCNKNSIQCLDGRVVQEGSKKGLRMKRRGKGKANFTNGYRSKAFTAPPTFYERGGGVGFPSHYIATTLLYSYPSLSLSLSLSLSCFLFFLFLSVFLSINLFFFLFCLFIFSSFFLFDSFLCFFLPYFSLFLSFMFNLYFVSYLSSFLFNIFVSFVVPLFLFISVIFLSFSFTHTPLSRAEKCVYDVALFEKERERERESCI